MNKRIIALSMACMTATSIVSCSSSSKKSGSISDIASAISETVSKDYRGIIASDAKYSLTDSRTIGYRREIRNSTDFGDKWLLIADGGKMQLFYAKNWDDTAKGYKKAENEDDLTLAEIYEKNISKFKSNDDDDDDDDDGGMIGYVENSKRTSANSKARTVARAVDAAFTDADAKGYDVGNIGYIVFEKGKIADINYGGKDPDKIIGIIEENVSEYFDMKDTPYAVVFCRRGSAAEVYWSEKSSANISGCYPVDEEYYGLTFDEIIDEKGDEYFVETKPSKPIQGGSGNLDEVKLKTGGDKFVIAGWAGSEINDLIYHWCDVSGYDENKVSFLDLDCGSGSRASERYDAYFASGEDIDLYFVEGDWGYKYINDDSRTAPLEDLGFSENNFKDCYSYTVEVGKATAGVNSGKMVGAAWQACPGAFAYRFDLAKQYLGVTTPEEMQEMISDWDKFTAAAFEISGKSDGKVALADSVQGMFNAYSQSRTTPWVVDNRLMLDDSCEAFAQNAKKLWENGGVSHIAQWDNGWLDSGAKGSTMGYFVSTWCVGDSVLGQASSKSSGKWNLVQGPSPYFWGGTWMVVNPATDNAEEIQSFIYNSCANTDAMLEFAIESGEFVNNIPVMQMLCENGYGSDRAMRIFGGQNYLEAFNANALAIDNRGLLTPYDTDIKNTFIEVLWKEYLNGSSSYADVVKEVSDQMSNNF